MIVGSKIVVVQPLKWQLPIPRGRETLKKQLAKECEVKL